MPRVVKPMSALAVSKLKKIGVHAVGGVPGLLLQIRGPESKDKNAQLAKSWILRVTIGKERVHLGLGSLLIVSLADAREKARIAMLSIRDGKDPRDTNKELKSALMQSQARTRTFKECAEEYLTAHASDYTNEKHRKQWASTIESYAYPYIGNMLVSDITMQDIKSVLNQPVKDPSTNKTIGTFWETKTETATRLQGRIKKIFDHAIVSEYRSKLNPAVWEGYLETQLPKPENLSKVKHQPAVPYKDIGEFMVKLKAKESISAKALQFLILTAVRSGSVRSATWSEIDYDNEVWNIPAEHTKTKQEHRVPLSPQAINLLKSLPIIEGNSRIFPSPRSGELSDNTLSKLMRDMRESSELKVEAVPHGFRSTFRDWSAEQTSYPDEIRKAASGHQVGDAVQQAYQRTDLLEKRRNLMNEWANFLDKPSVKQQAKVIPIRKRA